MVSSFANSLNISLKSSAKSTWDFCLIFKPSENKNQMTAMKSQPKANIRLTMRQDPCPN
jgi:hypothetical protein